MHQRPYVTLAYVWVSRPSLPLFFGPYQVIIRKTICFVYFFNKLSIFVVFRYFSLVKILIGLAACVSCTLLGYLVINITEALLLKEVPEGRHQSTMSLFLRTFLLTLTCKK